MDDVEIFIRLTWSFHHDFHFQIASGWTIRLFSWGKAGFTLNHIKTAGDLRELILQKVELQSYLASFWVFNVWICILLCYMVKVCQSVENSQTIPWKCHANDTHLDDYDWMKGFYPGLTGCLASCLWARICVYFKQYAAWIMGSPPQKGSKNLTRNLVTFWVSSTFPNHHHLTNTTSIEHD